MSDGSFKDKFGTILGFGGIILAMIIGIKLASSNGKTTEDTAAREILKSATAEQAMQGSAETVGKVEDDLATRILKEHGAQPAAAVQQPPAAAAPVKSPEPVAAAAPAPPPSAPAPAESGEQPVCTSADRALARPWCKNEKSDIHLVSTVESKPQTQAAQPQIQPQAAVSPPSPPASGGNRHPLLKWKELASDQLEVTQGRQVLYADRVIRAGCRVLGTLEDGMIVTQGGEPHDFTINVRGALDGCTLPETDGIRLVGSARMDNLGRYIIATITRCADRNPKRKTVKCEAARVKSVTGSDMLEGTLYDQSGWGIFVESMIALGMTPAVSKLLETAANAKTIFQAATASAIADRMQQTLERISQKISATFEGKEIHTPEGVMVIVLFKEDVIL